MAISPDDVRTPAMAARHEKNHGMFRDNDCTLCHKPIKEGREVMVAIDHELSMFVTDEEARERGETVSLYPVGTDCAKRIARALRAPSSGA